MPRLIDKVAYQQTQTARPDLHITIWFYRNSGFDTMPKLLVRELGSQGLIDIKGHNERSRSVGDR
jgi:hypothetical protein